MNALPGSSPRTTVPEETAGPRGSATFVVFVIVGALIRLALLPLPGTVDMGVWKLWTYNAAIFNPATLYGTGGTPVDWRMLEFAGGFGQVVYPPLGIYELGIVGRVYRRLYGGDFPNTVALTVAIKVLIVAMEGALLWLFFVAIRRTAGLAAARWASMAYWLNPSLILAGSALAYLDSLYMLPAAGAIFAATQGALFTSGALVAAAVLTKPQGVVLIPAIVLAVFAAPHTRIIIQRLLAFGAGGVAVSAAVVGPIVAVGGWPNLVLAMSRLAHHDMLSGNATNLWWIIGYVLRVIYAVQDMGLWGAITMRTRILAISRVIELGYPNPRLIGTTLAVAAMLWALWTARRVRGPFMLSAVGAFLMHAYATLASQVHENHLYAAIPLLVLAATARPRYRPLLWAVSAVFFLNLNLFYGVSEYAWRGRFVIPRDITVLDLTVWLSVVNCATLAWHATILARESRESDQRSVTSMAV